MKIIDKILSENININDNTFIFDIETTGLNSKYCKIILIGILYNCQNKTIIKQFFAENEDDEKDILEAFVNEISSFSSHITYNGLGFDIPFINYRLKKHNIDFKLNKEDDFDIYKFIKPFKDKLKLQDCSLITVENYFGIGRNDVIDGGESIKLYKNYIKTQDTSIMYTILLHNYEDIYNLSKLVNIECLIKVKLDLVNIYTPKFNIKIFPLNYKIGSKKLVMNYFVFGSQCENISIYNDNYSIISQDKYISLEININKGIDKDKNTILFFHMSKIIPLKFNDNVLEENIYTLCNFIIKNELCNL